MAHSFAAQMPFFTSSNSEASVGDVGRALLRHWRWVVIPTLLALAGALVFVTVVSPRYTGEAKIILQTPDSYFTRPGNTERYEQQPQIDEQAVASQVQVVMSRDLAREAIKRLDLVGNPEFDPEAAGSLNIGQRVAIFLGLAKDPLERAPEDRVLEKYFDNLLVYPVGKSRIVAIEFRSKSAELAAKATNTITELYLGLQEDAKKDQARSATTWLGTNIEGLRKRVADAEARVEAFRSKTGLLVGSGTSTLSAQQLSELSTQLAQARTARSDSQAKAKLMRDVIRDGRAFDIPDVANNELIRRLLEQRINLKTQLALELRTLLPQHPRIKELNAQLNDLELQVRAAAERIVRTLENDARIAGSRVEAIEATIETQKKVVAEANGNEVQLRSLERDARIQREQLETYLGRYREASARDTDFGAPPDARVVSRAVVPQIPSFPKKIPIVGVATFAALMLSIGAVVARELLADRPATRTMRYETAAPHAEAGYADAREPADFQFDLGHLRRGPILDADTSAKPVTDREEAIAEPDPRYDFAQLVERLGRTDIVGRGRRILVTGVEERGDVVRVSRGLALTLARMSRAVVIDSDADESTPVDAVPGLTDLVAGEATFADVIERDSTSRLHRIGTGTLLNEALTGSPESLDLALKALDTTYDWVICTVLGETDGELLKTFAPRVDSVVIASNLEPASSALVDAYEAVQEAGAKDVVVAREQAEAVYDQAA